MGVTIRSSVDCLIAACAIRNGLPILHSDRDFDAIARFTPLQSRYVR
jgi:predicted nucleic acid-binding protein